MSSYFSLIIELIEIHFSLVSHYSNSIGSAGTELNGFHGADLLWWTYWFCGGHYHSQEQLHGKAVFSVCRRNIWTCQEGQIERNSCRGLFMKKNALIYLLDMDSKDVHTWYPRRVPEMIFLTHHFFKVFAKEFGHIALPRHKVLHLVLWHLILYWEILTC